MTGTPIPHWPGRLTDLGGQRVPVATKPATGGRRRPREFPSAPAG